MSTPKRIGRIEFGLLSPEKIRTMSVRKIIWADTYDDDDSPYPQGLMDLHLGVMDPGLRCKTCDQERGNCPGHFGHIELAKPVIHVGHTQYIRKLLRSTCRNCSRLLISPEMIEKALESQVMHPGYIIADKEIKKDGLCPHCGERQLKIQFEKPTTFSEIVIEKGRKVEYKLTPSDIRARLKKIPDDDLQTLGINPDAARPEWTVLTVLPVPPVTMRPSIILENGQRSEDDLTHKLMDIIRINQRLKENQDAGAPQHIIEDLWELLQYHVTTYLDNEVTGCPPARHRSGRPLKTLSQRIAGRDGLIGSVLLEKRVNFSSRSVISPDPHLSVVEVGIPLAVANKMSLPVQVTPYNIEELRQIILNGPVRTALDQPCGANFVIRPDKCRLQLQEDNLETIANQIGPGWTVERQIRDGDIVLLNHQPSVHRMSIMAHRVKVIDGRTFRINPAVCPPYHADFDGDEMNLHVPQTEEARAEAAILVAVEENLLSPRFGGPIIGGISDHIIGIFLLTNQTRWFSKSETLYLVKNLKVENLSEPGMVRNGEPLWSNKQVFSLVLPKELNMVFKASSCQNCDTCRKELCERDAYVRIIDGNLKSGTIDNMAIGAYKGQIVHRIIRQYGMKRAAEFIDDVTHLAIRSIMFDGFSFGIDDIDLSPTEYGQIEVVMNAAILDVQRRIKIYEEGQLVSFPGLSPEETLTMQIMLVFGNARDRTGEIACRQLGLGNSAVVMATLGTCGSMENLAKMAGCLGQQSVHGERILGGYNSRTLPHFRKGYSGLDAQGFIRHSYKEGLNPTEFFFHAMDGLAKQIDAMMYLSHFGLLQRRLIYALQDLKISYDGTVRTLSGRIVQFRYGEDGTDPMKSSWGDPVDVKGIIEGILKEEVS